MVAFHPLESCHL